MFNDQIQTGKKEWPLALGVGLTNPHRKNCHATKCHKWSRIWKDYLPWLQQRKSKRDLELRKSGVYGTSNTLGWVWIRFCGNEDVRLDKDGIPVTCVLVQSSSHFPVTQRDRVSIT